MYLKTKALVLRVTDYNDCDALLTLMTPEHGKITAKVRGLRRKNSPMAAACQLLAFGEFTIYEYRGLFSVNEANAIELFMSLRTDLQKLALGTYFAQVGETVSQEDTPSSELLSLVLNCLFALSDLNLPEAQIKAVFELRTACIAGYTPNLHCCSVCADDIPTFFDLSGGSLLCKNCRGHNQEVCQKVEPGVLAALRYIAACDARKLFGFRVGTGTLRSLGILTEAYLLTQLDQSFSTLVFYKSLLI